MISCRSHQRSISDWIFSLASWCLWTITLKWNYTCMYRIECEIKLILCFTWNYSMTFPPCLAVRLAMWETTESLSWEYNEITTSWKPELYFLLQVIQSTGDLGHGKCFPWSSAFPNWKRCHTVLIHTCWGSMKKTKQLTSKSDKTLCQAAMLNLSLVTSLIQSREWKWHPEKGNKLLSADGTLGWGLLCSLGDGCCSAVPACFIWESCLFYWIGTWEANWAEFLGCSLNTGRIFWQLHCTGQCPATITDWFNSSIQNTNGWIAACGCRNSLSCCLSDTNNSHLGFGSGKNIICTIQFPSLVDYDVALLQFARTSSQLLPVGMPAGCAFLTSSTNDPAASLMAKLVSNASNVHFFFLNVRK